MARATPRCPKIHHHGKLAALYMAAKAVIVQANRFASNQSLLAMATDRVTCQFQYRNAVGRVTMNRPEYFGDSLSRVMPLWLTLPIGDNTPVVV